MKNLIAALALSVLAVSAGAATQTVTLAVPGMDCPVCPITIKKALLQVPGVSQTSVDFDKRQAVVTFDDSKTRVEALTQATRNAGYPSTVMSSPK